MSQQQYIRFTREAEGRTVNDISRQAGVHWRTAKRFSDNVYGHMTGIFQCVYVKSDSNSLDQQYLARRRLITPSQATTHWDTHFSILKNW